MIRLSEWIIENSERIVLWKTQVKTLCAVERTMLLLSLLEGRGDTGVLCHNRKLHCSCGEVYQVWSIAIFLSFYLITTREGRNQNLPPIVRETLHNMTQRPSWALNLALNVASWTTELEGHCQFWHARSGSPKTPLWTTDANLDCGFVKRTLFLIYPKIGKAPLTWSDLYDFWPYPAVYT